MAHFELLPPRGRFWDAGAVTSLILHGLLVVALLIGPPPASSYEGPIERFVVFMVPPDRETGLTNPGQGVSWSGIVGDGGSVTEPLPPSPAPVEQLPLGTPGDRPVLPDAPATPQVDEETALTEIEVDSTVVRDPTSAAPVYPPELLANNVEGSTFVHYVVDTTGRVDLSTITVIRSSHTEFARSVRVALAQMKFQPAVQASHRVRQWVQQNFAFKILRTETAAADTTS